MTAMSSAQTQLDALGRCGHVADRSTPGATLTDTLRGVDVTDGKDVSNVLA